MLKEIDSIKETVEFLMLNFEEYRTDDRKLYFGVLDHLFGFKTKLGRDHYKMVKEAILNGPPPESIRRTRQKIQEDGQLMGSNRKAMMEESKVMRKAFGRGRKYKYRSTISKNLRG